MVAAVAFGLSGRNAAAFVEIARPTLVKIQQGPFPANIPGAPYMLVTVTTWLREWAELLDVAAICLLITPPRRFFMAVLQSLIEPFSGLSRRMAHFPALGGLNRLLATRLASDPLLCLRQKPTSFVRAVLRGKQCHQR